MILFSLPFSSLPLFFQFTGCPSALKKNPFLKTLSVVPKTLPFFFSFQVAFGIKKKFTFQSHFLFLSPFPPLPFPSLFFLSFLVSLPLSEITFFLKKKNVTSFVCSSPLSLPFFN